MASEQKIYSKDGSLLHSGDFAAEENGSFRTFFMTCICGWRVAVNPDVRISNPYLLSEYWDGHISSSTRTLGKPNL